MHNHLKHVDLTNKFIYWQYITYLTFLFYVMSFMTIFDFLSNI